MQSTKTTGLAKGTTLSIVLLIYKCICLIEVGVGVYVTESDSLFYLFISVVATAVYLQLM